MTLITLRSSAGAPASSQAVLAPSGRPPGPPSRNAVGCGVATCRASAASRASCWRTACAAVRAHPSAAARDSAQERSPAHARTVNAKDVGTACERVALDVVRGWCPAASSPSVHSVSTVRSRTVACQVPHTAAHAAPRNVQQGAGFCPPTPPPPAHGQRTSMSSAEPSPRNPASPPMVTGTTAWPRHSVGAARPACDDPSGPEVTASHTRRTWRDAAA